LRVEGSKYGSDEDLKDQLSRHGWNLRFGLAMEHTDDLN